jgi:hypothetical protein
MIELTYKLYLEAVSKGVNSNPYDVEEVDFRCPKRSGCLNCPLDIVNESCCLIDILDNPQELFDSYYQRALKNNPEYLL